MSFLHFDPDNTLAGGLYGMSPREVIHLGTALCEAVELAVGADGCHGGIWPGNITCVDGQVAIGPASRAGIADMEPDVLEYVAPEQFWVGNSSPASDVYSIGLILYTALNKGVKPYFSEGGDSSPEARADAMQNRMKGAPLAYPASAGSALGDVVLKAVAYQAAERYATPGKLRAALEALPEGADVPAAVPPIHLSAEERENMPSYRVDKNFEEEPQPSAPKRSKRARKEAEKKRLTALIQGPDRRDKTEKTLQTLVSGSAAEEGAEAEAVPPEEPLPEPETVLLEQPEAAEASPPPPPPPPEKPRREDPPLRGAVNEDMDPKEFREGGGQSSAGRYILPLLLVAVVAVALIFLLRGCRDGAAQSGEESAPPVSGTPQTTESLIHPPVAESQIPGFESPSPTPEETEPPEETPEPVTEPVFELIMADVSWTQARDLCEQRGGHLATVRNQEQFDEIVALARAQNARFVWLGAFRGDSSTWYYVTGERMDFFIWDVGEPSAIDTTDGTREDYLLLWDRTDNGNWCYNDQRNDPVTPYPFIYGGRTAYVCEYD